MCTSRTVARPGRERTGLLAPPTVATAPFQQCIHSRRMRVALPTRLADCSLGRAASLGPTDSCITAGDQQMPCGRPSMTCARRRRHLVPVRVQQMWRALCVLRPASYVDSALPSEEDGQGPPLGPEA